MPQSQFRAETTKERLSFTLHTLTEEYQNFPIAFIVHIWNFKIENSFFAVDTKLKKIQILQTHNRVKVSLNSPPAPSDKHQRLLTS